jgi:WD40 repeat protein
MRQVRVQRLFALGIIVAVSEIGITALSVEGQVSSVQTPTQLSQGSTFRFPPETAPECTANLDLGFAGIAISPDGRNLAAVIHQNVAQTDGSPRLTKYWNLINSRMIPLQIEGVLDDNQYSFYLLDGFAFTPDSKALIGAYGGHTFSSAKGGFIEGAVIKTWDSQTGKEIRSSQVDFDSGRNISGASISISSDSKTLAWYGTDHENSIASVKLWNLQTNNPIRTFTLSLPSKYFTLYASDSPISLDNQTFASLDNQTSRNQSTIKIFSLANGKLLRTIEASDNVTNIALSTDGKLLFGASQNGSINVWDTTTGQIIRTMNGSAVISFLRVTSDNKTLLSGANDGSIKLWNIVTGEAIRTICFE